MSAVVFDWETTGLPLHAKAPLSKQPKGIEFGAVRLRPDGKIERELSLLINPQEPLEAVITKITGLTDAELADKPTIAEVMPQIREIFHGADMAIAHNLSFDKAILFWELERLGITDFPWPRQQMCTVEEHVAYWGRRPKMKELYLQTFDRPLAQKHRALDDAKALAEIVVALKLYTSEGS